VLLHDLKQCCALLCAPLVVALVLAILACAAWLRGRRQLALCGYLAAILLSLAASTSLVGGALLAPLEHRYATLIDPPPLRYVVVLGSDYRPGGGLTDASALDPEGLRRIVEGVRLMRRLSGAHLVVSGGAPPGRPQAAQGYARVAASLGIAPESIILLGGSLDTHAEAQAVVRLLGKTPFILVTSAAHMPRAMALMQRAGAAPLAAPTGQLSESDGLGALLPGSRGLSASERALHEYEGLLAMKVGLD
jgi:uncharacterized SAM-binding protein YcdF (DUF218 family)